MESTLRTSSPEDLQLVLTWVASPELLILWGGPALTYPSLADRIWREISASSQNTFLLVDLALSIFE